MPANVIYVFVDDLWTLHNPTTLSSIFNQSRWWQWIPLESLGIFHLTSKHFDEWSYDTWLLMVRTEIQQIWDTDWNKIQARGIEGKPSGALSPSDRELTSSLKLMTKESKENYKSIRRLWLCHYKRGIPTYWALSQDPVVTWMMTWSDLKKTNETLEFWKWSRNRSRRWIGPRRKVCLGLVLGMKGELVRRLSRQTHKEQAAHLPVQRCCSGP
jgi:hypothetical protein